MGETMSDKVVSFLSVYHNSSNPSYSTEFTSSTGYLTLTLIVLLSGQLYAYYYHYFWRNSGSVKKSSFKDGKQVLGFDDIDGPAPFVPVFTKLIGILPRLWPYSKSLKQGLKWSLKYRGIAKCGAANTSFVALISGPLIQQLFKSTDFGHGVKAPVVYNNMKPFITNGLLVSTGKFWQRQRKALMKTQCYQSLKAYMGMLNKHSIGFVKDLEKLFEDGKPHQINETINIFFLKIICEMITGYNVQSSLEFDHYHHNFQIWKESLLKRIMYPWFMLDTLWKLHPMSRVQSKAVEEMFEFARRRIKEHKEKQVSTAVTKLSEEQKHELENSDKPLFRSVLDELVDAGVADDQIVDEVNTMLFGGHETGATTIHFFCFAMALNPKVQKLCQKEIDELFETPECFKNGMLTYEAAQSNLKYVERCILEALRLFPPVFIFLRKLESPLTLEDENRIYLIPAGVNIIVSPFVTQRDPEMFPDPDRFDPDRFLPEVTAKRHAYSFIPFSGGARNCLGQKFAMIEMKVVVTYLLRKFTMTTNDKMEDIPLLPFVTLTPEKEYTFEFKKRGVAPELGLHMKNA